MSADVAVPRMASRGAWRVASRVRRVRQAGPLARPLPVLVPPLVQSSVVTVAEGLGARPALWIFAVAVCAAVVLHVVVGASAMSLRPQKKKTTSVTMAVAPVAEEPLPELPQETPPVPAVPAGGPAPPSAARASVPGPIVPGLSPVGFHAGNGLGVEGGGDGVGTGGRSDGALGAGGEPPRIRRRTPPTYPVGARARAVTGSVTVHLHVDERGAVSEAVVQDSTPPGVFDDAALQAVRSWVFEPARRRGLPVDAWLRQTLRFELE